jgi:hypothetical protein
MIKAETGSNVTSVSVLECFRGLMGIDLNSDPLDLAHADIVVTPIVKTGRFSNLVYSQWQPIAVSISASVARRRTMRQTSPRSIWPPGERLGQRPSGKIFAPLKNCLLEGISLGR